MKTHNYLNVIAANLEVKARDPEARAVLLDTNGNLAEGMGNSLHACRVSTTSASAPRIPGPITRQLSDAYCRFVDFDFVGQYLKRLK